MSRLNCEVTGLRFGTCTHESRSLQSNDITANSHTTMDQPPAQPAQAPLPLPVLAIKQAICFSCWHPSQSLSRCASCKRVSYCSSGCQKEHWKGHKRACKPILGASNLRKPPVSPTGRSWEKFRVEKVCCTASGVLYCSYALESFCYRRPQLDRNRSSIFRNLHILVSPSDKS